MMSVLLERQLAGELLNSVVTVRWVLASSSTSIGDAHATVSCAVQR